MFESERVLRYNPPISLIYVAILLISFTFSLTFFEYTDFLGILSNKNKDTHGPLDLADNLLKNQPISNSSQIEKDNNIEGKESQDNMSKKDEEIKKTEKEKDNKQKEEKNDKNDIEKKEDDNEEKHDKKKLKDNQEEKDSKNKDQEVKDDNDHRRNRKEKESQEENNKDKMEKEEKSNVDESQDTESSGPIFKDGRTFDRLYAKTLDSPLYSNKFPKLKADTEKMEAVKEAFLHAWNNYDHFCFGHDAFNPQSRTCHDNSLGGGLTIIDSISTIIVMGLEEPYKKAVNFVKNKFEPNGSWSLFEFNIRYLGGLLSAYSLSHNKIFKKAAVGLGDAINKVMEITGGFFKYNFDLKTVDRENFKYRANGSPSSSNYILAECGTFQLEFFKLAEITGDDKYIRSAINVYKKLWNKNPQHGLISSHIGAGTDSYYEYIIKSYLMTGGVAQEMLNRHILMMKDIKSKLLFKTINKKLVGIGLKGNSSPKAEMEHLATFAGGMIALGSVKDNEYSEGDLTLASKLATTYAETYAHFKSGIMPEHVRYNVDNVGNKEDIKMSVDGYILRPETVESIFYLYRFTGDQKYRDYNWQIFKAINKSCRVANGFTSISDVDSDEVRHKDSMESFFLAETLKYLYLTFADSSLISPVEWVFNTEAHPLHMWSKETVEKFSNEIDVKVRNSLYREKIRNIDGHKKRRNRQKTTNDE